MHAACIVVASLGLLVAPSTGARLQERCKYDVDCLTELTYCKNQMECACKTGYEPLESLTGCRAVEGAECTRDYDCTDLGNFANSHCVESTCTCREGFVTNPAGNKCLPKPVRLTDSCEETLQCTQAFGYSSFCNTSKQCSCTVGYHFVRGYNNNNNNNNGVTSGYNYGSSYGYSYGSGYPNVVANAEGKCVPSVSLRQACRETAECEIPSLTYTRSVQCQSQLCQCSEGFQELNNVCVPAKSSHLTASFATLLATLCLAKMAA